MVTHQNFFIVWYFDTSVWMRVTEKRNSCSKYYIFTAWYCVVNKDN